MISAVSPLGAPPERIDHACPSAPRNSSTKAALGMKAVQGLIRAIAGSAYTMTTAHSTMTRILSSSETSITFPSEK